MNSAYNLLNNKDFSLFARLAIAAVIAIVCAAAKVSDGVSAVLCSAAVIIAAYELILQVFKSIFKLKFFTEQLLMLIALIITIASGHCPEAVLAAMLFRVSDFLCTKLKLHALAMAASAGCHPDTEKRSRMDAFVAKALRYYIPAVIIIALLLALIPMLFAGDTSIWLARAAIVLMVGAPCAITFSIPVCSLFAIYRMSHEGVAINSAVAVDMLAAVNTVVFDKTDALADSKYIVGDVFPVPGLSSRNLLILAAYAAVGAKHPAAPALSAACGEDIDPLYITGSEKISGLGILAHVKGLVLSAGNWAMMDKLGLGSSAAALSADPEAVHIALNGTYAGCVIVSKQTNESAKAAVDSLTGIGISRIILFSSDSTKLTARTAHSLGIGEYFAEFGSAEKGAQMEKLLAETFPEESLCYIGDSPALLAQADVGISTEGDIPGCDGELTSEALSAVSEVILTAKHSRSVIIQGLAFAFVLKLIILILTLIGTAPFWLAVLADSGVAILTAANAMRAGR